MHIVVVISVILVTIWLFRRKSLRLLPRGPKGLPILGLALELDMSKVYQRFYRWAEEYGRMFSFRVVGIQSLVLNDGRLVRKAFADKELYTVMNERMPTFFGKYVLYGYKAAGFSMYEDSMKTRKYYIKGLHLYGDGFRQFERSVGKELKRFVKDLKALDGGEFFPKELVMTSFCMVTASLLTGEHETIDPRANMELMFGFLKHFNIIAQPLFDTILMALPILRYTPGRIRSLYLETLAARDRLVDVFYHQQKKTFRVGHQRGLIDFLFQQQAEQTGQDGSEFLTDERIKGMILETVLSAVLTSTHTTCWALLALLYHPRCMEKIRRELDTVVGSDRPPSFSDRSSMPYTEAVLLETLRYVSVTPFLFPHRNSKDVTFEGIDIPKDTQIIANIAFIHHDKEVWGDPWTFRPERFLDEEGQLVSATDPVRQSFLIFGVGKRHCVGEALAKSRLFLYLTTLVQKFDIKAVAPLPPFDPRTQGVLGLVLETPTFHCRFTPRT